MKVFFQPSERFVRVPQPDINQSEIQPDPGNPATPIPGLSETVANLTVYYERDGVQARISNRYRSEFLGEVAGFGNGRTLRQVGAESIVDARSAISSNRDRWKAFRPSSKSTTT